MDLSVGREEIKPEKKKIVGTLANLRSFYKKKNKQNSQAMCAEITT